jgi:hypothetical protein
MKKHQILFFFGLLYLAMNLSAKLDVRNPTFTDIMKPVKLVPIASIAYLVGGISKKNFENFYFCLDHTGTNMSHTT